MTRVQIGYDPASGDLAWRDPDAEVVHIDIRPDVRGLQRHCRCALVSIGRASSRPPGKLDEYPTRAEHARARRLRSERLRRNRRRARAGRAPIRLRGRAWPRMLEITNALASAGPAFARAGQAVRQFSEGIGPDLAAMQRRINEDMQALAAMTAPHRFMAGTVLQHADAELTESGRARRDQALASPYITADELWDVAAPDQTEQERVARYRRYVENRRVVYEVDGLLTPMQFATGGVIHERRDPDDDSIPVQISPGEVWAPPLAARHHEQLLRALNRSNTLRVDRDVTHHDRLLGQGALDRDETSGRHSLDSSGSGAVWSDLMARIDDLVDGEDS